MAVSNKKVDVVKGAIKARIKNGGLLAGQKLPSVRDLSKSMGVSPVTVSLAVYQLKQAGLIKTCHGKGTFVSASNDSSDPILGSKSNELTKIALVYPGAFSKYSEITIASHPLVMQWMRGMQEYFRPDRAIVMPMACPPMRDMCKNQNGPLIDVLEKRLVNGFIISEWIEPEEYDFLREFNIPFVLLSSCVSGRQSTSVEINTAMAIKKLMKHLYELGHRQIEVITYKASTDVLVKSCRSIVMAARNAGFDNFAEANISIVDNYSKNGPVSNDEYFRCIESALSKNPTAIIAADEIISNRLILMCNKRQISIPEQLSIASIYDMAPESHWERLTTLNTVEASSDCAYIASELLEELIQGVDVPGKRIEIVPSLIKGQTTAPLVCNKKTSRIQSISNVSHDLNGVTSEITEKI
jgi:DNA-binding LacI/PurR family transcriptional regulator